jgi:hypothetical protein
MECSGLLLHDQLVRYLVYLVGFRAFEQVERINLHVDEFDIIERFVLFFSFLIPENDDPVLHLFAAENILHTVRSGSRRLRRFVYVSKNIRETSVSLLAVGSW